MFDNIYHLRMPVVHIGCEAVMNFRVYVLLLVVSCLLAGLLALYLILTGGSLCTM